MVKGKLNKRRVFIILLGIITIFAIYLVIRGEKPLVQTNDAPTITSEQE